MKQFFATLIFVVLFAAAITEGQEQKTSQKRSVGLLAVQCVSENGVCARQRLVLFRFRQGELISKDLILTAPEEVMFNLGRNHIYRNRYVITNWGDVIDIQKRKVLHTGDGEYRGIDGERMIQYVNKTDKEGYFYYDLLSGEYARLRVPGRWALPGLPAPDQTKSAESNAYEIRLHSLKGKPQLLGSEFFVQAEASSSVTAKPPLMWLGNESILTQKNNGEIVLLGLDKTVTPVVKIPVNKENFTQPVLFRNRAGHLIYQCCGQSFVIDVKRKTYASYDWVELGSDFSAENNRNPDYGHIIRYKDKEIGRLWSTIWRAPIIDGYAAFEYGAVGSNLGYPKGLKVWSSFSEKWTTLEIDWLTAVIGWIEE